MATGTQVAVVVPGRIGVHKSSVGDAVGEDVVGDAVVGDNVVGDDVVGDDVGELLVGLVVGLCVVGLCVGLEVVGLEVVGLCVGRSVGRRVGDFVDGEKEGGGHYGSRSQAIMHNTDTTNAVSTNATPR